jgi:hypothetical protein
VYCVTVAFTMTKRADQLHHDNVPAHSTVLVQALFWQNITSPRSVSPSYSPDLAPCDFWLFPKLKLLLKRRRVVNAIVTQYTLSFTVSLCTVITFPSYVFLRPWSHMHFHCAKNQLQEGRHCICNVTLRCVYVTTVTVERQ